MIKLGVYKHYKGKYYQVIGIAKHSETLEELVVYYCLYLNQDGQLWVRSAAMFQEQIIVNGKKTARFTYVDEVAKSN